MGIVSAIDIEEGELVADFDGREIAYGFGGLDELVLAYAATIHKSQGSEYPAVVIPLSTQHYPMLQRLHRGDARQASSRIAWAAKGVGDRGQGKTDAEALVEIAGLARDRVLANIST